MLVCLTDGMYQVRLPLETRFIDIYTAFTCYARTFYKHYFVFISDDDFFECHCFI